MRPSLLAPALLLLVGCESGLATVVHVEVDDAVATAHTADAPGVLVTDAAPFAEVTALAPLCGAPLEDEVTYSYDFGFGCLDDAQEGTEEVLRAWVQPVPADWDLAAFCALEPTQFSGLAIGQDVTGEPDPTDTGDTASGTPGLVEAPEASWPQGDVRATWKRDLTPCGGILLGDIRVE
ncbi:MAG: hypothetical protein Q8P41_13750 [Pseudomonadota bacterium]|nr:hypothetical protein [Pseudomonadota bacterium]